MPAALEGLFFLCYLVPNFLVALFLLSEYPRTVNLFILMEAALDKELDLTLVDFEFHF